MDAALRSKKYPLIEIQIFSFMITKPADIPEPGFIK